MDFMKKTLNQVNVQENTLYDIIKEMDAVMKDKFLETFEKVKVEFKNVSFAYPGMDNENVIENFNLVINPGETIGILGATGCGKSSLVNLIPRFYDVTKGEVLIDDVNVKDYDLQVLRDKVSIALQKPEIFSTTIAENIAWGDDSADIEKIRQAADIAQATE